MSMELLTSEQAAAHLGVSVRTVYNYIRQGLLAKVRDGRRTMLRPLEVEELRIDLDEKNISGQKLRSEVVRQRAEIRRMRAELDVVLRILDTRSEPLKLRGGHALGVYQAALSRLQQATWAVGDIAPWVRVFLRISEEDFREMQLASEDPRPWVPFLRLVHRMIGCVVKSPAYSTSMDLQQIHRELAECRRRVRISAMCFMDTYAYDMDTAIARSGLLPQGTSVKDDIEALLRRVV